MIHGIEIRDNDQDAPCNQPEQTICSYCNGEGEYYKSCCGDDIEADTQLCPTCQEHTDGESETCEYCDGTGYEPIDE